MSKKDNTEQAILQAAETEFLDKGFALAKTTEIAKQAGVTHAMLHYYYRTKEKLFERVFQEKVDLMAHSLVATLDDGKPFLKQMEDLTGAHFDFIAKNPKLPFFLLNEIHLNEKRRELYLPVLSSAVGTSREARRGTSHKDGRPDVFHLLAECNVFCGTVACPTGIRFRPGRRAAVHLAATGREH